MATITGTGAKDTLTMTEGVDVVNALGADDVILGGANVTRYDQIDGGAGFDELRLDGEYAALVFAPTTLKNVEQVTLLGGHDYNLRVVDANAEGSSFVIDGREAGSLTFNGVLETSSAFTIRGSEGDDILTGGASHDVFLLENGGQDRANGGAGDDLFRIGDISAGDRINGGEGHDVVVIGADGGAGVVFSASNIASVEEILIAEKANGRAEIVTADSLVGAGKTMQVSFESAGGNQQSVKFDGSAETDGDFAIRGGYGDNTIKTGAGDDDIDVGGLGRNIVHAGAGDDDIYAGQSFGAGDMIDGGEGHDRVMLSAPGNGQAVLLTNAVIRNVEVVAIDDIGPDQRFVAADDFVAASQTQRVYGGYIERADQRFTFDASAETNGHYDVTDGAGNDYILTGGGNDDIDMRSGGTDRVSTGGGDDLIRMFDKLNAHDQINGGDGYDSLNIGGDYGSTIELISGSIKNIEYVSFDEGHDYKVTFAEGNIAPGQTLDIGGHHLSADNALGIDTGKDTDGSVLVRFAESFRNADSYVHAGAGDGDTIMLDGDYSAGLVFGAGKMAGVERISLYKDHSYKLATHDANVEAGATLEVSGYWLDADHGLNFNGSAETNGSFRLLGGFGDDTLTGGAKADYFDLSQGGRDKVTGGGGDDTIYARGLDVANSFSEHDVVNGGSGYDSISLSAYSSVKLTASVTEVERLHLWDGDVSVVTTDAFLGAGKTFTVDGSYLDANERLTFNGSAETDGAFQATGGAGADLLRGGQKGDSLAGGAGDDRLFGFGGDDTLSGGVGADRLDGGEGSDTASYAGSNNGVQVSLLTGRGTGAGDSAGDVLTSIENLIGSSRADVLTGSSDENRIDGGSGDDVIEGGAGADILIGGSGVGDVLSYAGSNVGVAVNLATGFCLSGDAQGDKIAGFENIHGSAFTDTLVGDSASNALLGGGGDDWLQGGGGSDLLVGGLGNDRLTGGAGSDIFRFEKAGGHGTVTDFGAGDRLEILVGGSRVGFDDVDVTYANGSAQIAFEGGAITLTGVSTVSEWHFLI